MGQLGTADRGAVIHWHHGTQIIEWRSMPPSYPLRFRVGRFNGKAFATLEEATAWVDSDEKRSAVP
jgi:hypothetical protein